MPVGKIGREVRFESVIETREHWLGRRASWPEFAVSAGVCPAVAEGLTAGSYECTACPKAGALLPGVSAVVTARQQVGCGADWGD